MNAPKAAPLDRQAIIRKGLVNVVMLTLMIGGTLFLFSGRVDWPQAWILLAAFLIYFITWLIWGLRNSPDLIMERVQSMTKESPNWDKIIIRLNIPTALSMYVIAGIDYGRTHWSSVPPSWQSTALVLVLLSYIFSFWALASNPFASGVVRIQTERGHKVSKGGPYRFVRHPMYTGAIIYGIGVPLFLGSWWALIPGIITIVLFAVRTNLEDQLLQRELQGYSEYAQQVRYRWIPGVW